MGERFTCPRRAEVGMDRVDGPFKGAGRDKDEWKSGRGLVSQKRGCSYCGSMNPDDFMEAVRSGNQVGPTDKSYKVYVGDHEGKFYFPHLSPEQGTEFKRLYAEGKVNMGYPGHFYTPVYLPMLPEDEE